MEGNKTRSAPGGNKRTQASTPADKGGKKAVARSGKALPDSHLIAETHTAEDDLSRQGIKLGFLVHDVSRMRRAAYDQLMKPLNFTRARWWVLANLSRHDGMMQSQLADILDVGKASLGAVVEQLETDGWVERRADPADKRAKRVFLTKTAHAFVRKMTQQENQFNERILNRLSVADRDNLIRLLSAIKQSLSQLDLDAGNGLGDD